MSDQSLNQPFVLFFRALNLGLAGCQLLLYLSQFFVCHFPCLLTGLCLLLKRFCRLYDFLHLLLHLTHVLLGDLVLLYIHQQLLRAVQSVLKHAGHKPVEASQEVRYSGAMFFALDYFSENQI